MERLGRDRAPSQKGCLKGVGMFKGGGVAHSAPDSDKRRRRLGDLPCHCVIVRVLVFVAPPCGLGHVAARKKTT